MSLFISIPEYVFLRKASDCIPDIQIDICSESIAKTITNDEKILNVKNINLIDQPINIRKDTNCLHINSH